MKDFGDSVCCCGRLNAAFQSFSEFPANGLIVAADCQLRGDNVQAFNGFLVLGLMDSVLWSARSTTGESSDHCSNVDTGLVSRLIFAFSS